MRIMARGAHLAVNRTEGPLPIAAGSTVNSGFPVPVSRAVATAAQSGALDDLQMAPIASLEQLKVGFIVTIKTIVVAMVPPVRHHDVIVFLGDHHIAFGVKLQLRGFVLFMAGIAIKPRSIAPGSHQVRG